MKIFLRDKNFDVVNAWSSVFTFNATSIAAINYENILISQGQIFDLDEQIDAIVSPANSFGFMDGGIDLDYLTYFGADLQTQLQQKINSDYYGELPVGQATVIETGHEKIKYLISAPTMRIPSPIQDTLNAYLAFRAALIEAYEHNKYCTENKLINSILFPGLGTGAGKLEPQECAFQMRSAYNNLMRNEVLRIKNDTLTTNNLFKSDN